MSGVHRMTVAEFRQLYKGESKFSAKTTVVDGMRFHSKLEARRYEYWRDLWRAHAIAWFTRQVPFYLPGGIIWRADFVVCELHDKIARERFGDAVRVEDTKGHMTEAARNKIVQVEHIYGFKVHIVRKGDF